jgi:AcrR family transcriptional regulator
MGAATSGDQTASRGPRRGRPASASPAQVLRAATEQYLGGERVDVTVVARRLGVSRATIYRWFGSRERLLGEAIAAELEQLIARKRAAVRRGGPEGLLDVFDAINRSLAHSEALRRLFEQEPGCALRVLTSSGGIVQQRAVVSVERLIADQVAAGRYDPPAAPATLAYAIVRLAEAFLYKDAEKGIRGDHERLREVEAALLGVPSHGRVSRARARRSS